MLLAIGEALALALGFATTLIVTDRLGRDYGVFIGAQRFVGLFLVLAEFGLGTLLVRSVAARREEAGILFATVLALRLVLPAPAQRGVSLLHRLDRSVKTSWIPWAAIY